MATVSTSAITTPTMSTTGTRKRFTIGDMVRKLFPRNAVMLAMVSTGPVKGEAHIVRKQGMIAKKMTKSGKYESFTYTPLAIEFTVSARTSDTEFTVSDATGLAVRYTLVNTTNFKVCRISAISTNTLTITAIGDDGFTVAVGDKLLGMGNAYPENSSNPAIIQKDEDNIYNHTSIQRWPVAISRSAAGEQHYGEDTFWQRLKTNASLENIRRIENALLFSDRAASTAEKTTDATLSESFGTFRGMNKFSGATYNFNGSFNPSDFITSMVEAMNESVDFAKNMVMLCGQKAFGEAVQWAMDDLVVNQESELKKYGVKARNYVTAGPDVEMVVHDAYNRGNLYKIGHIFQPEDVMYVYRENADFKINRNIQSNSTDGLEDEILWEGGYATLDGGESTMRLENLQ